jgi:hypothetical protein
MDSNAPSAFSSDQDKVQLAELVRRSLLALQNLKAIEAQAREKAARNLRVIPRTGLRFG